MNIMNIAFAGGGSFRALPIMRSVMAAGALLRGGRVWLVGFNLERAEAVGRMIMRTPEFAGSGCEIRWTDQVEQALPGADVVERVFLGKTYGGFSVHVSVPTPET